jgi:hypothetical protein
LSSLGEFSIRPQQAEVRAVFVSLRRLQKELQLEGKVNTILVSEREHGQAWQQTNSQLETVIRQSCRLEDLGIKVRALEKQQCLVLESESTLINQNLEQAARATADELGLRTSSILTYLANLIRSGQREVPYSLVTAMDRQSLSYLETEQMASPIQGRNVALGRKDEDVASSLPPILLNDWAARDLGVQRGADISLVLCLAAGRTACHSFSSVSFRLHPTTQRDDSGPEPGTRIPWNHRVRQSLGLGPAFPHGSRADSPSR